MKNVSIIMAAVMLCVLAVCPGALGGVMSEREVDDAMVRGYTEIKAKDVETAKATFAAIVQNAANSPKAPEAMMVLGALQFKTDRTTGMNTYKALAEKYPDSSAAATVLYRIGSEEMRLKHFSISQDAFRAAAEKKSFSSLNRGRALLQVGFIDIMRYFAATDGASPLGSPGSREQYLETALKQFEATRALYAGNKEQGIVAVANCAIGEIYLLSRRPVLAQEAYRRVVDASGSVPGKLITLGHYGLGQAFFGQGDLESALPQFEQALNDFVPGGEYGFGVARKMSEGHLHSWRVATLYGLKRFDAALIAAREARTKLEADPELAQYGVVMDLWEGLILCHMDKQSEGLKILLDVASQHPGTSYATQANTVISQFEQGDK